MGRQNKRSRDREDENAEMEDKEEDQETTEQEKVLAQNILTKFSAKISQSLNVFCQSNMNL